MKASTKFKGGTLTFNMCRPADSAYTKHKIYLESPAQYQPTVPPIVNKQVTSTHPEASEALSPRR